jgi:hypothetical protein
VAAVVDHADAAESAAFRALSVHLFARGGNGGSHNMNDGNAADAFATRSAVYEQLLRFFPEAYKQPSASLTELVPMRSL